MPETTNRSGVDYKARLATLKKRRDPDGIETLKTASDPAVSERLRAILAEFSSNPGRGQAAFESLIARAKINPSTMSPDPAWVAKETAATIQDPRKVFNILAWYNSQKKNPYKWTSPKRKKGFSSIPDLLISPIEKHIQDNPEYTPSIRAKYLTPKTPIVPKVTKPKVVKTSMGKQGSSTALQVLLSKYADFKIKGTYKAQKVACNTLSFMQGYTGKVTVSQLLDKTAGNNSCGCEHSVAIQGFLSGYLS